MTVGFEYTSANGVSWLNSHTYDFDGAFSYLAGGSATGTVWVKPAMSITVDGLATATIGVKPSIVLNVDAGTAADSHGCSSADGSAAVKVDWDIDVDVNAKVVRGGVRGHRGSSCTHSFSSSTCRASRFWTWVGTSRLGPGLGQASAARWRTSATACKVCAACSIHPLPMSVWPRQPMQALVSGVRLLASLMPPPAPSCAAQIAVWWPPT